MSNLAQEPETPQEEEAQQKGPNLWLLYGLLALALLAAMAFAAAIVWPFFRRL